ncbi:MAG: STM4011 family radical SAM protein [Gemmataceae bacterium]
MIYRVLYRGPLSSCNYACGYCPFAKRAETHAELAGDRRALDAFLGWLAGQSHRRFGVLFTPWGEALVRRWYQHALVALSHLDHVHRAAIQTNLSCGLDWIGDCRLDRLALWATYHPAETTRDAFVGKVRHLHERGVRLSVGVVGLREHLDEIAAVRRELPSEVYLWVNAYKREAEYYSAAEVRELTAVDPHFPVNNTRHVSRGEPCGAGETSFTVDGDGTMRRCHFVGEPIGSIHSPDWEAALGPRPCPNATCGCHIGYVHLKRLRQDAVYGENILERIPLQWDTSSARSDLE